MTENDTAGDRSNKSAVMPLGRRTPCPVCGKPAVRADHPFCSKRCADIDLNRWLAGAYAIPGTEGDEEDEEGEPV